MTSRYDLHDIAALVLGALVVVFIGLAAQSVALDQHAAHVRAACAHARGEMFDGVCTFGGER